MPIEIRELVIRAVTTFDSEAAPNSTQPTNTSIDQEEIIQECVRQVLKILKKEKER